MDSSLADKLEHILPFIDQDKSGQQILSIGAGTGKLERAIADIVPTANVIALDASVPMLDEIQNANHNPQVPENTTVTPLLASAEVLPIKDDSIDVVIASSVIHEIASYKNNFEFSEGLRNFFVEVSRVLKKGGKLVIRDFMQPQNPEDEVYVSIGSKRENDPMDSLEFLEKFTASFKGDDLVYVASQINELKESGKWTEGAKLKVKNSHAFELLSHFSWSQSFNEEVREKYAYLPVGNYAKFVQNAMREAQVESQVLMASTYMQEGYKEHIHGRLDLIDQEGNVVDLPDFTGIVVIQKQ